MDGCLVERARSGDPAAWRELVGEHMTTVAAVTRAFGLGAEPARDVNQAVWLRLAEHLRRIRSAAAVGGWIAATARREALDPRRDVHRSGRVAGGLEVPVPDGCDGARPDEAAAVARAFARLGAFAQRLLRLRAARPCPSDDVVAAALDMPATGVDGACDEARGRLEAMVGADPAGARPDVGEVLRRAVARDPVPRSWWSDADAACAWLCIDAVPADVVYDSSLPGRGDSRSGLAGGRRSMRFSTGSGHVDLVIDVTEGGGRPSVALRGHLVPAHDPAVVARWPGGAVPVAPGPDGVFHLQDLPLAPLCVEVDGLGVATAALKTGWIFP